MANDSEEREDYEHLERASAAVRFRALISSASMKFLFAALLGVALFTIQTGYAPKPSDIISVNRKPFEESIARLGMSLPSLVTAAYAAAEEPEQVYNTDQRAMLVTTVIIAIFIFWVFCFVLYFTRKEKEKVKFAGTMIQTVLGFFIGILTGMIGSPRR